MAQTGTRNKQALSLVLKPTDYGSRITHTIAVPNQTSRLAQREQALSEEAYLQALAAKLKQKKAFIAQRLMADLFEHTASTFTSTTRNLLLLKKQRYLNREHQDLDEQFIDHLMSEPVPQILLAILVTTAEAIGKEVDKDIALPPEVAQQVVGRTFWDWLADKKER